MSNSPEIDTTFIAIYRGEDEGMRVFAGKNRRDAKVFLIVCAEDDNFPVGAEDKDSISNQYNQLKELECEHSFAADVYEVVGLGEAKLF